MKHYLHAAALVAVLLAAWATISLGLYNLWADRQYVRIAVALTAAAALGTLHLYVRVYRPRRRAGRSPR